jgi:osmotically-inducible protein OsmY
MKLTMNRTACTLLAAAALAAGLSACAPLVVGGAVMGGMMATDRRTTGTQVEDEGIERWVIVPMSTSPATTARSC